MTVVWADPDQLRPFASDALIDLSRVRHSSDVAQDSLSGVQPWDGFDPPLAEVAAAQSAIHHLTVLVSFLHHVADAFERLDDEFAADRHLGALLTTLANDGGEQGNGLLQLLGSLDDPNLVSDIWASLPTSVRDHLATTDPATVGGLHGLPLAVRDRANRSLVNDHIETIREMHRFTGLAPSPIRLPPDPVIARHVMQQEIDRIRHILDADLVIEFDPTGHGRAVVAWGDPELAETVATFIPGMSNSLATMGVVMADAHALHGELRGLTGADIHGRDNQTSEVATVAWLGYDAPSGFLWGLDEAVDETQAQDEQQRLIDYAAMIRALNPNTSHSLAVHSYGSVLAMQALLPDDSHDELDIDRLVMFGSPGGGEDVGSLADLSLAPGFEVYAAAAQRDPIPWAPVLGPNPMLFEGVIPIPTGHGNGGHSTYLAPGSLGAENIARSVLGLPLTPFIAGPRGWSPPRRRAKTQEGN